jgi:FkbM family methyltransferase
MTLLARLRYRRLLRRMAGPRLLRAFAAAHPDAVFIEIGSNDGEQHDHLRPFILDHAWRGVMVEPVPYVFERLLRNYAGVEGVTCANVAVGSRDGTAPFFHLREAAPDEPLPRWYDAIGSFSREAVLRHAHTIPDVEHRIVQREVPVVTFDSLCRRHGLERVDLLLIDAEGHDSEILRDVDLGRHHPRMVVYEHFHLPAAERQRCRHSLEEAGYLTMEEGFDTFCVDTAPDDGLTRCALSARPAVPGVSAYDGA